MEPHDSPTPTSGHTSTMLPIACPSAPRTSRPARSPSVLLPVATWTSLRPVRAPMSRGKSRAQRFRWRSFATSRFLVQEQLVGRRDRPRRVVARANAPGVERNMSAPQFEQVHDRVYRLPAPFEGGGLVNLYLIRGSRTAIVDSG